MRIFTDSIDVRAVVIEADALYKTYDCPATGCGALPPPGMRRGRVRLGLWRLGP
jgi:hypothetical protein